LCLTILNNPFKKVVRVDDDVGTTQVTEDEASVMKYATVNFTSAQISNGRSSSWI